MTNSTSIAQQLGAKIDIYVFDQIMKNRYQPKARILDAGCGHGRNIHWFVQQKMEVFGFDKLEDRIEAIKTKYPSLKENFQLAEMDQIPFKSHSFNHVICSAVLHFAKDEAHFKSMFAELMRVLKPKGSLFIRMCSDIGIENKIEPRGNGRYFLPDKTERFLLTKTLLAELVDEHNLVFLEPLKTTNVNDLRCMSTLVLTYSE